MLKGLQKREQSSFGKKMVLTIHQFLDTSAWSMPSSSAVSRCLSFLAFRIRRTVCPSCAREEFVGVVKPQVGEHTATADFVVGVFFPGSFLFLPPHIAAALRPSAGSAL